MTRRFQSLGTPNCATNCGTMLSVSAHTSTCGCLPLVVGLHRHADVTLAHPQQAGRASVPARSLLRLGLVVSWLLTNCMLPGMCAERRLVTVLPLAALYASRGERRSAGPGAAWATPLACHAAWSTSSVQHPDNMRSKRCLGNSLGLSCGMIDSQYSIQITMLLTCGPNAAIGQHLAAAPDGRT